ncbi:glycosyltransferase [Deminuibacter soli]|uniref:Glycosyltransferase n=1 Tax=Deminuibacter soli TaxID=2291815 RepID=A0A3E1NIN9_9BACT|nr:glycosyltransferase [Deminuibacter soli]RFM27816.1 glycosyltransferase [Deminuibacter soli]
MTGETEQQAHAVLVSIVIATYNAADYLQGCLQSIADLSLPGIEVVIIDGGSTDATPAIAQSFTTLRMVWQSGPDAGIYDALNKGITAASGRWLHFLGADDRLLPGFATLFAQLKQPGTVYYGSSEAWYGKGERPSYVLLGGPFSRYRLAKYCMNHQCILYPAAVFARYRYNLRYRVFADYALNIQVWGDPQFKKQFVPVKVALYNMTGFSSVCDDLLFRQDKARLIRKHMGMLVYLRFMLKRYKKKREGATDFQ